MSGFGGGRRAAGGCQAAGEARERLSTCCWSRAADTAFYGRHNGTECATIIFRFNVIFCVCCAHHHDDPRRRRLPPHGAAVCWTWWQAATGSQCGSSCANHQQHPSAPAAGAAGGMPHSSRPASAGVSFLVSLPAPPAAGHRRSRLPPSSLPPDQLTCLFVSVNSMPPDDGFPPPAAPAQRQGRRSASEVGSGSFALPDRLSTRCWWAERDSPRTCRLPRRAAHTVSGRRPVLQQVRVRHLGLRVPPEAEAREARGGHEEDRQGLRRRCGGVGGVLSRRLLAQLPTGHARKGYEGFSARPDLSPRGCRPS